MSVFDKIAEVAPDATFALMAAFKADANDKKVNLCPGIYQDDNSKTWVLPSVKKVIGLLQHHPVLILEFENVSSHFLGENSLYSKERVKQQILIPSKMIRLLSG